MDSDHGFITPVNAMLYPIVLTTDEYYNFAKELANNSSVELFLVKDKKNLAKFVKQNIQGNKIVIGMGAGSISNWMRDLPNLL